MEILELLALWTARGALGLMLVAACLTDLRHRRIPNWLSATGLAFALLWHALAPSGDGLFHSALPGGIGLLQSALGASLCLGVFGLLYAMRIVGAGDAKLVTAVGAFAGFPAAVSVIVSVLIAGGALALARMILAGSARLVWANLQAIFMGMLVRHGGPPLVSFEPATQSADRMPYALAIGTGVILHAAGTWVG